MSFNVESGTLKTILYISTYSQFAKKITTKYKDEWLYFLS